MLQQLLVNHYEAAAVLLSGIGLTNLLLQRNLIKKIIGFNIMNTAVCLPSWRGRERHALRRRNCRKPPVYPGSSDVR